MVEENFKIRPSHTFKTVFVQNTFKGLVLQNFPELEMAKNALSETNAIKLSNLYLSKMSTNQFELSTMVGENFEIYLFEMAKMYLNCQHS